MVKYKSERLAAGLPVKVPNVYDHQSEWSTKLYNIYTTMFGISTHDHPLETMMARHKMLSTNTQEHEETMIPYDLPEC